VASYAARETCYNFNMQKIFAKISNFIRQNPISKWLILGFIILIIIINVISIFTKSLTPPALTDSSDLNNLVDLDKEIILEFDRSPNGVDAIFHPAIKIETKTVENILIIKPLQLLSENTDYQLELQFRDKTFANLEFKTRLMEESEIIIKDAEDTLDKAPLIKYLPLDTPKYYVAYIGPLELGIKIKQGNQASIKSEIEEWIINKGIDPATHKLTFENIESSQTDSLQPNTSKLDALTE